MLTLNYNDLGAIKSALLSDADHFNHLTELCQGGGEYWKKRADQARRLADAFDKLGSLVLDLDLHESETVRVKFF